MTALEPTPFFRRCVLALAAGGLTVLIARAAPVATETAPPAKESPKETSPPAKSPAAPTTPAKPPATPPKTSAPASPAKPAAPATPDPKPATPPQSPAEKTADPAPEIDPDDEVAAENQDAQKAAVAKPVTPDLVQVYGWREHIFIKGVVEKVQAKLDTGALTSSIHAEEKELFERDGKKWVRFIVTDPSMAKPIRTRIEAPLVRIARVKEPGGQSTPREVVKLSFTIGERKLGGEFTLNNRSNMLAPVLIGRNMIKVLGWVDPSRTYLAEQKIFR